MRVVHSGVMATKRPRTGQWVRRRGETCRLLLDASFPRTGTRTGRVMHALTRERTRRASVARATPPLVDEEKQARGGCVIATAIENAMYRLLDTLGTIDESTRGSTATTLRRERVRHSPLLSCAFLWLGRKRDAACSNLSPETGRDYITDTDRSGLRCVIIELLACSFIECTGGKRCNRL